MEYSDKNITKLVSDWFNNENADAILEIFKTISSGPKSLDAFTSAFHAEEYVAGLLENAEILEKLKSQREAIIVSKCILSFDNLSVRWARILIGLVNASSDEELIDTVLSHKDAETFPVELIETCWSKDWSYFETIVLNAYRDKSPEILRRWEIWSAKSPLLFRVSTSILNEFLYILKDKNYVYEMIEGFVNVVKETCDSFGFDFVSLYPANVQKIVAYILLYEKSQDEYLEKIIFSYFENIKRLNYRLSVILSTHFRLLQPLLKEI